MLYPTLGRSGLRISQLVLGTVTFGDLIDGPQVDRVVATALDNGISTFDTGNNYGMGESERLLGLALGSNRQRAVICTKVGLRVNDSEADHAAGFRGGYDHAERWKHGISPNEVGLGRMNIIHSVEGSLRRLETDWIDLLQVHRWDSDVPLEETMGALDNLVRAGKVRYIGCSQYAAAQLRAAAALAGERGLTPFISMQQPYNIVSRAAEAEVMPAAKELGVGLLTFQALAGGILTGAYKQAEGPGEGSRVASRATLQQRYWNPDTFAFVERLTALAKQFGRRPEELAIAWNLAQPAVAATLVGADKPEDVLRNVVIAQRPLGDEELTALRALAG
jgi:aryl-alcohol dehydrogenase-like predicted oxidoreductase